MSMVAMSYQSRVGLGSGAVLQDSSRRKHPISLPHDRLGVSKAHAMKLRRVYNSNQDAVAIDIRNVGFSYMESKPVRPAFFF